MSSKSLKRNLQIPSTSSKQPKIELISERHSDQSEDDIIRSRLAYEGDQGSDDRRILTLMKMFNKSTNDISSLEIEKLQSLLYSIEHSYRLLKSTRDMDVHEQLCYTIKIKKMYEKNKQLRYKRALSKKRLIEAERKRSNLLEYNRRIDSINKLGTRKELRAQQVATLERKRYFEHLQQTFETNYRQRLKQIAIYMRPILEFDEILRQDAHEDGMNEFSNELQAISSMLSIIKTERPRTYSDSSMASLDGDDDMLTIHSKKEPNKNRLEMISLSLANNQPQPLFSNDIELYGTQLVNPLLVLSSSSLNVE
ncbi:unnamed protein product [Adineta steineri]|uniref:Uncharacterized protein n=1 Tax=Adineta steineri TaxID=433720 RepID=A0A818S099_9BILA|nr:unnamed protein product [Adineta steineri]CAF3656473.1 unnamed protein product [Adineta steineri]